MKEITRERYSVLPLANCCNSRYEDDADQVVLDCDDYKEAVNSMWYRYRII